MGGQSASTSSTATSPPLPGGQSSPVGAAPDRRRQDRARRRNNQDISSLVGRSTSASWNSNTPPDGRTPTPIRAACASPTAACWSSSRCSGADQGAAPAPHRHPGRQLQGHRGFGAIPLRRHRDGALQRVRMDSLQNNRNNEAFLDRIYTVKVPCTCGSTRSGSTRSCSPTARCRRRPCAPTLI